jgi:ferredoxin-NADP reductase
VALLTVPLARVEQASVRSRLLIADISGYPFQSSPGQAVMMAPHGAPARRPFSLASSPERATETHSIELLIAMEGGSEDLRWATAGALIDLEGPFGTFTFPASVEESHLLFVAGGTGIAPVRAMLDHALRRHPTQKISLLYSTRRSDEFVFTEEFRNHERAGRLELHQTVTRDDSTSWDGKRGRISRSHFVAVLHEPASTLCFVCGPASLVNESAASLEELGVPAALIRTEEWRRPA